MSAWKELYDDASSRNYYFNEETNEVSWDLPAELGEQAAPADADTTLPPGWIEAYDEGSGKYYYVNEELGETTWDRPVADIASADAEQTSTSDASEWIEVADDTGAIYYFNPTTNETSWEKPATDADAATAPASGSQSPFQSDWVEQIDPSSGMTYYVNNATGVTQWENPFDQQSPPDSSRGRLDTAMSALSTTEFSVDNNDRSESPQLRGLLRRSSGSGLSSAGTGTPTRSLLQTKDNNSSSQLEELSAEALAQTQTQAQTPGGSSVGKHMTLFGNSELNLPAFGTDSGGLAESVGKSPKSRNNKKNRPPDYASAPSEFMADFFALSGAASSTTSHSSRRRSSMGSNGSAGAAALAAAASAQAASVAVSSTPPSATTAASGASGDHGTMEEDGEEDDDVDLTPAEVAALDVLDLIESGTTAVKVSEILLSVNLEALQSPYVLSQMCTKLAPFGLEKYAEAHFQYDRRANSNSSTLHSHPVEKLLTFQSDLLKAPLTVLPTAAMGTDAVACFRLICAFLDNTKSSGLQQIDLAVNLLLKLITAPTEFHDEIYCQICKQTRKTPSAEALEFGWQLMILCLATIPPSKRLLPHLINYISASLHRLEAGIASTKPTSSGVSTTVSTGTGTGGGTIGSTVSGTSTSTTITSTTTTAATTTVSAGTPSASTNASTNASSSKSGPSNEANRAANANAMKFVLIALRTVLPAASAAVRTEIPTRAEIRALLLGETMEITVGTMIPTMHHSCAVNSYTTVESLLQMVSTALGVQELNKKIFSIFEVSTEGEAPHLLHGQGLHGGSSNHNHHSYSVVAQQPHSIEVELSHQERVLDWVSRCQRAQLGMAAANQIGSSDERDNFTSHRAAEFGSQNHPSGAHISYKLLFKAKYIYHISDHSSDPVTMELLYAQSHSDVISARYLHTPADAVVLAAFQLQELCGDYHAGTRTLGELKVKGITLSKLISRNILETNLINKHELETKIFTAYKTLAGTSKDAARKMYLSYISCWKVFGATFFIVSSQVNNFTEIVLSVSVNSIVLLDPVSMQFLAEYQYGDVYSWGHSFDSFVLIIGSKTSQSKSYFKTPQGKDIDGLVKLYHAHHMKNNTLHSSLSHGGDLSPKSHTGVHSARANVSFNPNMQ